MVQADRALTAMEMAFTLPDQTESEGTMRMEGDPAALADDAALAKPKRNRRRRSNKAQQERTEDGVAEDVDETDEESEPLTADSEDIDEGKTKRRRRRGRRGGRRLELGHFGGLHVVGNAVGERLRAHSHRASNSPDRDGRAA